MLNSTRCITPTRLIPVFAFATLLAGVVGGSTAHAAVNIQCSVPLNVVCTVSEPQGIKSIAVQLETAMGTITVVDESFACVSTATVTWDPIVPGGDIQVTTCGGGGIVPPQPGRGYAQKAITYDLKAGVIHQDDDGGALYLRRPNLNYVLRAPVRLVQAAQASFVMQMLPLLGAYTPGTSQPTPVESSFCCDEGTLNNCFGVNLLAQCGEGLDFVSCHEDDASQQSICESSSN